MLTDLPTPAETRPFDVRVLRAAAVVPQPFLIPDLIVAGQRLSPSECTAAFHVVRAAMARGEFTRNNDGYRRTA
jgi:hypothetical protein